jgi:glycine/serine hydroxymethyltransferase
MARVVDFIDQALVHSEADSTLESMRAEVKQFMGQFPLYPELG